MAAIVNTVQTFAAKGLREQLSDIIYNIAPTETPFITGAGKGSVKGTFNEWQTDSLLTPNTANQQIEGDDVTAFDAVQFTVRLGNYQQISRKTLVISDTEEVVDKAGRKSEIAYQAAKKGKEMKRDMEAMLLNNIAANAGSSTTARVTGSLLSFVKTNQNIGATGAAPVYTSVPTAPRTDGTQRAFTETILKDVIQQAWTSGAAPATIMLGALQKQVFSGFAGVATKYKDLQGKGQGITIGAVDVYVSDFGTLNAVPNRFQRNRDAWVLDWEYVQVDYLRPFKIEELAKTGDAEKRLLITEYGLRVKNEAALGLCADLV